MSHKRLKILDLDDRSNQPLYCKQRRYLIIYNGKVYNYRELAKEYNIQLRTSSDTELVLELYILLGSSFLKLLNGMFSFIIFDTLTGKYFVARDRLGIKPLYCFNNGLQIILYSEISPIVYLMNQYGNYDEVSLRQYKKLRTFFNDRTLCIFRRIRTVKPEFFGHETGNIRT